MIAHNMMSYNILCFHNISYNFHALMILFDIVYVEIRQNADCIRGRDRVMVSMGCFLRFNFD